MSAIREKSKYHRWYKGCVGRSIHAHLVNSKPNRRPLIGWGSLSINAHERRYYRTEVIVIILIRVL